MVCASLWSSKEVTDAHTHAHKRPVIPMEYMTAKDMAEEVERLLEEREDSRAFVADALGKSPSTVSHALNKPTSR